MSAPDLLTRVLAASDAATENPLTPGRFAVVSLPVDGEGWRTPETYATPGVALAIAARWSNDRCNAYVVKRHAAGTTAYLGRDVILGTRPEEPQGAAEEPQEAPPSPAACGVCGEPLQVRVGPDAVAAALGVWFDHPPRPGGLLGHTSSLLVPSPDLLAELRRQRDTPPKEAPTR